MQTLAKVGRESRKSSQSPSPGTFQKLLRTGETPSGARAGSVADKTEDVIFPLAMLLALALIYRRLLAGWVIATGDLHTYFFPYWTAAARAFQAARLPLWNPHLFAGAPLLANSQVGVFYPLNWPLWLLSGLICPFSSVRAGVSPCPVHLSVVLHLALAALATYGLARRWRMSAGAAALAGLLYAGSGYLGVQTEHLNQLQGLAWLPLVLLPGDRHGNPAPLSVGAMAMILLAGHTQTAFIAAIAATVWRLGMGLGLGRGEGPWKWSYIAYSLRALLPFGLAGGIALAQLLPTLELTRFSARGGGLPWREAVSFSVAPWQLPRALLPPYLIAPLLPEGVAYLGLLAMALAGWGAWQGARRKGQGARDWMLLLVAALGGFLALGGFNPLYLAAVRLGAPGLVHFRAPARFLVLYVLAVSLLAGRGLMALGKIRRRAWLWRGIAAVLVAAELLFAAELMPLGDVTAPRAYTDLRPATAHLVAATRAAEAESAAPAGRYLSMSQALFDPGDLTEIRQIYGAALTREWGAWGDASEDGNEDARDALWAYLVAAKQREVLAPNLSLVYEIPAVDGYDGGVLPLRHYSAFSRLLLSSPAELTSEGTWDGRLRENLTAVPDGRWLSLLGVRFLLTDKTGDAWADDIFYDRQFQPALAPGERLDLAWLPADFEANAVGVIYEGAGTVVVHLADGATVRRELPAIFGEGLGSDDPLGAEQQAQRVRWPDPATVTSLALEGGDDGLRLSGLSLVDERTGAFYPLTLSDRFRLVHSGDVKIYENLSPQPRAFFAPTARCFADDEALLRALHDPAFDPTREVALSGACETTPASPGADAAAAEVQVRAYDAARVEIDVTTSEPGHLVLTDAWYPGWRAEIAPLAGGGEAREAEILRADALFRAVAVSPGAWRITFTYRPAWLVWGLALSAISWLAWGAYALKRHATAPSKIA